MKWSKSKILVAATILSTSIYLVWRICCTMPFEYGFTAAVFGILLLGAEVLGMISQMIHFQSMTELEYPEKPDVTGMEYPSVDVFIATYNEPVEVLYKTVNGCCNMEYPELEKVKIYLCDDSGRQEVKELAEHFHIEYLARKEHTGAKAGNLNHALRHSQGDLVVTFDADMIPMKDFLISCIPYFMQDLKQGEELKRQKGKAAGKSRNGKIGFVQTPQSFYNLDLFQFYLYSENTIPNEQDYFYRDIQLAKNRSNSIIYGGSNTVLSREALEEIGGFVTNVITEDFATGMLIQSKGYQCIAIDEVHASGLSPEDLKNLVKQRKRWARGCIQTGRKLNVLFCKGLSIRQKISYMASISYWYDSVKRLIYMMAPILFSVFGITVFVAGPLELLVFWLPMYWINSVTIRKLSGNIRTLQWTNIYETIMCPLLCLDVLKEMAGISQKKFSVTRKGNVEEDTAYHVRMAMPHIMLATLTGMGILRTLYMIFSTGNVGLSFLLFWLISNLYHLIMALFFMLGRKSFRKAERFQISCDCELSWEEHCIKAETFDISEGGFSVVLDEPRYMDPEMEVNVVLRDLGYEAKAHGKIVQVMQTGQKWRYAFNFTKIEETEYRQLLFLLHDRVPPHPRFIQTNIGFYDNIRKNVEKRMSGKVHEYSRRLPRILMQEMVSDADGERVMLLSFDYWYVSLKTERFLGAGKDREIFLNNQIAISLSYERKLDYFSVSASEEVGLYKIKNRQELIDNPAVLQELKKLDLTNQKESEEVVELPFDELALL